MNPDAPELMLAFDPARFAQIVPAIAVLPLPGWLPRLMLALGVAGAASAMHPTPGEIDAPTLWWLGAEGAFVGLVAGLPIHAWSALNGRVTLVSPAITATVGWAVFLGLAGPVGWVVALAGQSSDAVGAAWFGTALVLGLPLWWSELILAAASAWLARLGGGRDGRTIRLAGGPLLALSVALLLPIALDWVAPLWRAIGR